MTFAARCLVVGCLGTVAAAQSPPAPVPAPSPAPLFVEVVPASATVFVEQPLRAILRVGYDAAFFAAHAVPLLNQPLDLPFAIRAPWLGDTDQQQLHWQDASGPNARRGAVGGEVRSFAVVPGATIANGPALTLLELPFTWTPLHEAAAASEPVEGRYAFASGFTDDFLSGRQPVDRHEASVFSEAPQWTVRALPQADRPADFTGAVGQFVVSGELLSTSVAQGGTLAVAMTVRLAAEGSGNLARFGKPALPELAGFAVQGLVERTRPGAREFVFDLLALRAGATAVPPLPFVVFDARAARYTTLQTEPLPLVVAAADVSALPPRVQGLIARDAQRLAQRAAWPAWLWLLFFGGLLLAGLLTFMGRRLLARRRDVALALRQLEEFASDDAAGRLAAFERLCCVLAHCPTFGPQVFAALGQRGLDEAGAHALHGRLADACYGGGAPSRADVVAVARRLAGRT